MERLQSALPSAALSTYTRAYAQRKVNAPFNAILQPFPASLEQILEFDFGDPLMIDYRDGKTETLSPVTIAGASSFRRASLRFHGQVESFAVFFQPFGFWQLFGIPNSELRDSAYPGRDLLGSAVDRLWLQMAEARSFERRVEIIEAFLIKKAHTAAKQTSLMTAATHIFQQHGMARIATVADDSGLSIRQFERKFKADVGVTPKLFAKISRFQTALDTKLRTPRLSWMTIAQECGYHDQMHMLHDFKGLAGETPTKLLAQLGDTRPLALTTSRV